MKLRTETISGSEVAIEVTATGYFELRVVGQDDRLAGGYTLDHAISEARGRLNKQRRKVKVPFRAPDGTPGVANGIHASTHRILARLNGKAEQYGRYDKVLKPDLPDSEVDRLREMRETWKSLNREIRNFERDNGLDLYEAVEAAIAAEEEAESA